MTKTNSTAMDVSVPVNKMITSPPFILMACCAVICAIGLSFAGHALLVGHEHTFGTTREVPWGILIASYVFFASLSTGLCIVASLGQVFNIKAFKPIVGRTVFLAIVTIAAGLMSISLELENPWRVPIYSVLSAHPESNIWWKSTIYSTYLILMILNLVMLLKGKTKAASRFALFALIACLAANLNMKADMSVIGSRGFWKEQYMPIFFLTLAALEGCAAVMFTVWLSSKISKKPIDLDTQNALTATGKFASGLLGIALFFTVWKIYAGLSSNLTENPEAMELLVRGAYSVKFWLGEVILAVGLPLTLILATRSKNVHALATAGISTLVGIFLIYYDLVVVGQLVPHFHNYNVVDLPRYFSYTPSLHENMILIGAIFFALAAFFLGEVLFNGQLPLNLYKNVETTSSEKSLPNL